MPKRELSPGATQEAEENAISFDEEYDDMFGANATSSGGNAAPPAPPMPGSSAIEAFFLRIEEKVDHTSTSITDINQDPAGHRQPPSECGLKGCEGVE